MMLYLGVPIKRFGLIGIVFGLVLSAQAAFAQQTASKARPLVLLTKLSAPHNDLVAEKLASTMTSSLEVIMRMTGSVNVERADFLVPTVSFDRALGYYKQVHADGAVYGSVSPAKSGGYTIELGLWNSASSNGKPRVLRRIISNVLSSFRVADSIALEAASTIVGRKLSEGTLVVRNLGSLRQYAVYADGHLIGRNRSTFRVLTGKRTIIVAKPGVLGDVPVQSFHVDIKQGQTSVVALPAPPPSKPAAAEHTTTTPVKPTAPQAASARSGVRVFVAGVVGKGQPAVWADGRLALLPIPAGENSGVATGVGSDPAGNLIVVGRLGTGTKTLPTAWRNGRVYVLSTGTYGGGRATSVAFDRAGNVYIGGIVGTSYPVPVYWKNGHLFQLGSYGIVSYGGNADMTVDSEGVPHAAGYSAFISTLFASPQYWTKTKMEDLISPKPYPGIEATGITIDTHGNLFISGTTTSNKGNQGTLPVVWVNNWLEQLPLPEPSADGGATAVAVDASGNLYVSGYVNSRPAYWLNGSLHFLPVNGAGQANSVPAGGRAESIAVDTSGNFFISGWVGDGPFNSPVLWVNGKIDRLSSGADRTGRALGVAIGTGSGRATAPQASGPEHGQMAVTINPQSRSQGAIRLQIVGSGKHIQLTGDGKQPFVASLAPGVYELTASHTDDSGVAYHQSATVRPGRETNIEVSIRYSTKYKLNGLMNQREAFAAQLRASRALRKRVTSRGVLFDLLGASGLVGAGVLAYLANQAYQNYSSSTDLSSIVTLRSQITNYRIFTAASGAAGLLSFIGGSIILHSRPSTHRITDLENSIETLDRQIQQLRQSEATKQ